MLAPVTGLTQTAQDSGGTSFGWLFVTDADAYDVLVDGVDIGEVTTPATEVTANPGPHIIGVSPVADPTPATVLGFTVPAQQGVPDTPANLTVQNVTQTTADVQCDTVAGATSYGLYLGSVLQSAQATPIWHLTGLVPDTQYGVAVDAANAIGPSAPSAVVTFTTAASVSPPPPSPS